MNTFGINNSTLCCSNVKVYVGSDRSGWQWTGLNWIWMNWPYSKHIRGHTEWMRHQLIGIISQLDVLCSQGGKSGRRRQWWRRWQWKIIIRDRCYEARRICHCEINSIGPQSVRSQDSVIWNERVQIVNVQQTANWFDVS